MSRRQRLAAAATIGLPLAWLVLLETGLAHRWDVGAVITSAAVLVASVAAAWWWLRWWTRR